ncbi:TonB-linked SusC/RagA family outer membrane protein [Pedobacter sp. AK017]|uniref:SusC/RagA family TonB-linked outer membrane protein n=1 Tax=Pedobacter sp. AK017 TaxID=2723073 RepID=UPI00161DB360|nr:SusC/RagA family TonB-linked outer membrane protein [Pedobacter sp. AK017]MBB5437728.1 TonB-linked SusC/RagA family outer membrane protein [Pedobacter sp. AK017]
MYRFFSTILIIVTTVLQVNASTYAQKVTFKQKNATIIQIFNAVKKQTGYHVVWIEDNLKGNTTINVNFKNTPLKDVLNKVLEHTPLSYIIDKKTIIIKKKEPSFQDRLLDYITAITVHGSVVDDQNQPLSGAIVKIKGSNNAISTNSKGEFTLTNVNEEAILVISYVGFETKEVPAKTELGIIKLISSTDKLKEVEVNAGYYTVKSRERTGNITQISAKTIEQQPVNNPLLALQGRVPGVEIIQASGVPGAGVRVRIRGQNSLSNGNDPLYVVNGVPFPSTSMSSTTINIAVLPGASPLSVINPNDIESIEILKDADATAIYGSRGANGVILITTKKGKAGDLNFNVNFAQGAGNIAQRLNLLNTEQYIEMRKEAFKNDGTTPGASAYDVNGTWDQTRYTDWQEELMGGTANTTNAQLSISGGSQNTTFLISGNYYRETNVFPGDKKYQRKSSMFNINHHSANQKFKISASANLNIENNSLPTTDIALGMRLAPNAPAALTPDGKLNWENGTFRNNPLIGLFKKYNADTYNFGASSTMSYEIAKNLNVQTAIGYNRMQRAEVSTNPLSATDPLQALTANNRTANYYDSSNQTLSVEPQVSWNKSLSFGKLSILIGTTIQQNQAQNQLIQGTGYVNDGLLENKAAAATVKVDNAYSSVYRYLSVYGRLNYSFKDRYYLNITGRRDGSSRFGPESRYGNFGALGLAWIFSDENFLKNNFSFLSYGKLRASYGLTGNDQVGDYAYLDTWSPNTNPYQAQPALSLGRIFNPNLEWETNKKAEISLELGFFKNKLNLTSTYFRNRSSNQLIFYPLAPSVGFPSIQRNLAATIQNTGLEFELSATPLQYKNFKWTASINLSVPRNKLAEFPGIEKATSFSLNYIIGQSMNISKVLESKGVDPQTGLYTFTDFDGSNTISNPGDRRKVIFVGQRYSGGIQNSISYKRLELDFFFQFVKQNGRNAIVNSAPGTFTNQLDIVLRRWQQPDDVTDIQKYSAATSTLTHTYASSLGELGISDASYLKLKNIALGYRIPDKILKSIGAKNAKAYLQGQNLFTITNYLGLDPESVNFLPPLRMVTAGFQITF